MERRDELPRMVAAWPTRESKPDAQQMDASRNKLESTAHHLQSHLVADIIWAVLASKASILSAKLQTQVVTHVPVRQVEQSTWEDD